MLAAAYITVIIVAALANLTAAGMDFVGHESVKLAASRVGVSEGWMVPFGVLLLSGGIGLLVGLGVPVVGTAAAAGLVGYFVCAVGAHLRVHDRHLGAAAGYLSLGVACLALTLAHHGPA